MFTFVWSVERHNNQPEGHQTYTAHEINKQIQVSTPKPKEEYHINFNLGK